MGTEKTSKLAIFEGKRIRKAFHDGEWWFSITDAIDILVGGDRPRKYWNDLKKKLLQEGYDQLFGKNGQPRNEAYENIVRLKRTVADETQRLDDGVNKGWRLPT